MIHDALPGWRRYLFNSSLRYLLRIFFALTGCAAVPWWLHQIEWTIPLTLGVVAAALVSSTFALSTEATLPLRLPANSSASRHIRSTSCSR